MRPEAGAIILAAGLSRRMGAANKLLLPVLGVPMIRRVVDTYAAVCDGPVHVVTGHERDAVEAALAGSTARTVFNPDFARGQATSVVRGLHAAPDSDLLLIGLADQPLLQPADLRALIAAHQAGDPAKITIPQTEGTRGNPLVVPQALRARLLSDPKRPGCAQFTRTHGAHVRFVEVEAPGFFMDIDTPEAYATLVRDTARARTSHPAH